MFNGVCTALKLKEEAIARAKLPRNNFQRPRSGLSLWMVMSLSGPAARGRALRQATRGSIRVLGWHLYRSWICPGTRWCFFKTSLSTGKINYQKEARGLFPRWKVVFSIYIELLKWYPMAFVLGVLDSWHWVKNPLGATWCIKLWEVCGDHYACSHWQNNLSQQHWG